jgi:hypothetical protein
MSRKYSLLYVVMAVCIACAFFVACQKDAPVNDIDFQRHLVAGTGSYENTKKIWKLDSLAVDGKAYALTTNQKKYTKTFNHSGAYMDSDGFSGVWEIAKLDELTHTSTSTTGTKVTSVYEIMEVNSAQLNIRLLGTTSKYEYFFIISN